MKKSKKDFIKKIYLYAKKRDDEMLQDTCNRFCELFYYNEFQVWADADKSIQNIYFNKKIGDYAEMLKIDVEEGTYSKNDKKSHKIQVGV